MKRLHYILFAMILFMSFTITVEANTKCKYTYDGVTFVLETDEGGSTLNKVTTDKNYYFDFKIYNNGISLNRAACPKISIIDTHNLFVIPYRKIYPSKETCQEDNGKRGNQCSNLITGTKSLTNESTSSILGTRGQFNLVDSSSDTCNYRYEYNGSFISLDVKKNGNSLKFICSNNTTDTCNSTYNNEVKNAILNSGNFTCPQYLYGENIKVTGNKVTNFDIVEAGTSDDKVTSGGSSWERGDEFTDANWNNNIGCDDIFSNEPGSVGNILRTILGYIRVIGPILVVLLSAIDFINAIFGFDEKAMSNAQHKLIIRLIAVVALFLIPTLIDVLLDFINATTCTLK